MTTRKEIDAIFGAFKKADRWCSHEMRASKLAEYLRDEGFTITSVEPAMSDAELEREAVNGHRTPEALTPESVECALQTLCITSYSCNRDEHEETLRTHIAAQQAEVERLRFAAANLLDNLHGLTKLQEVQHRAPTWMKAIENSADRLRAIINPEHVSEAKHLEKGGE